MRYRTRASRTVLVTAWERRLKNDQLDFPPTKYSALVWSALYRLVDSGVQHIAAFLPGLFQGREALQEYRKWQLYHSSRKRRPVKATKTSTYLSVSGVGFPPL